MPPKEFFEIVDRFVPAEKRRQFRAFRPDVDYVGPEGSAILSALIPQEIMGEDMRAPAWAHDELFRQGGCWLDKLFADVLFLVLCLYLIEVSPRFTGITGIAKRAWARYRALTYFQAVRIGGDKHFNWSKECPENSSSRS